MQQKAKFQEGGNYFRIQMAQSAGGGTKTVASLCRLISEEAWDEVYVQTHRFQKPSAQRASGAFVFPFGAEHVSNVPLASSSKVCPSAAEDQMAEKEEILASSLWIR